MATVVLWAGAVYLGKLERNHWICTGPAVFMSAVCVTFLLYSPLGAGLKWPIAVTIGALAPFPPLSLLLWSIASRRKRAAVETGDGTTDG
jgi:carbon starvation protein CstA